MDYFFCSTLNATFYILRYSLPEVLEYAKMRYNMMTSLAQTMRSFVFRRAAVQVYPSSGVLRGM